MATKHDLAEGLKAMRETGAANCALWPYEGRWYASGHLPGRPLVVGEGERWEEAVRDFIEKLAHIKMREDAKPFEDVDENVPF